MRAHRGEKTLGRMLMEFGTRPRDVVAALGQRLDACCYEVGPEVAQAFAAQFSGRYLGLVRRAVRTIGARRGAALVTLANDDAAWSRCLHRRACNSICAPQTRWQLVDAGVPGDRKSP